MVGNGPNWFEELVMTTGTLQRELTKHLDRAHELGERAKESNDALVEQLRRAREIADELKDRFVTDDLHE
jgi:hypothetical protein